MKKNTNTLILVILLILFFYVMSSLFDKFGNPEGTAESALPAGSDFPAVGESLGEKNTAQLASYGIPTGPVASIDRKESPDGREVSYDICLEGGACLNLDKSGSITTIIYNDDGADGGTLYNSPEDAGELIEKLKSDYNITKEYELAEKATQGDRIILVWYKSYGGIYNPSESLRVFVSRKSGAVLFLKYLNIPPETTEALLTADQAIAKAEPLIDTLSERVDTSKQSATLRFTHPNNYWTDEKYRKTEDAVRLNTHNTVCV